MANAPAEKESRLLLELKAELKQMQLTWWKQPEYDSILVTQFVACLAAAASIAAAVFSSVFPMLPSEQ